LCPKSTLPFKYAQFEFALASNQQALGVHNSSLVLC
jgi:hypothetical protein